MGTTTASMSPAAQAFQAWRTHGSAARVDTTLATRHAFQDAFPDHHLTQHFGFFDLPGFAAAGHAELTPVNSHGCWATKVRYVPPNARLQRDDGRWETNSLFTHYVCRWRGTEFQYFDMNAEEGECCTVLRFILSPLAGQTITADNRAPLADALLVAVETWEAKLHEEMYVYDGCWSKDSGMYAAVARSSWADVILAPQTKAGLGADARGFFANRELYAAYNVPWKRGVILHGTPGNGKTASIKALLRELGGPGVADPVPGLYVKSLKSRSGKEGAVKTIFAHARNMAPCVLVFEDLDSLISDDVRTYFLNEVDGLESNDGILMIGSTNNLATLDSAIAKRPSRFDRKYKFDLPAPHERRLYAEHWQGKLAANKQIEFGADAVEYTVSVSEGFSFAYMKELFVTSLLITVGNSADQIETVVGEGPGEGVDEEEPEMSEALKRNEFVVALGKQAQVLRREMNSVEAEQEEKGAKGKKGGKKK